MRIRVFIYLFLWAPLFGHATSAPDSAPVTAPELGECTKQVQKILVSWKSQNLWSYQAPSFYLSPTTQFGSWVIVNQNPTSYFLARVDQKKETRLIISKANCELRQHSIDKKSNYHQVTDVQLWEQVKAGKGIIYLWSPHMPLSYYGLSQIQNLAKNKGLELIILLDPKTDPGQIPVGTPGEYLAQPASLELQMRKAYQHFPTIFAYKNGRILNQVKYGYEEYAEYEKYFAPLLDFDRDVNIPRQLAGEK